MALRSSLWSCPIQYPNLVRQGPSSASLRRLRFDAGRGFREASAGCEPGANFTTLCHRGASPRVPRHRRRVGSVDGVRNAPVSPRPPISNVRPHPDLFSCPSHQCPHIVMTPFGLVSLSPSFFLFPSLLLFFFRGKKSPWCPPFFVQLPPKMETHSASRGRNGPLFQSNVIRFDPFFLVAWWWSFATWCGGWFCLWCVKKMFFLESFTELFLCFISTLLCGRLWWRHLAGSSCRFEGKIV